MESKITLRHPDPAKATTTINHQKYTTIRQAIIQALQTRERLTYAELARDVEQQLAGRFDGSIRWYVTVVKLDLEGRGKLERIKDKQREYVQLTQEERAR